MVYRVFFWCTGSGCTSIIGKKWESLEEVETECICKKCNSIMRPAANDRIIQVFEDEACFKFKYNLDIDTKEKLAPSKDVVTLSQATTCPYCGCNECKKVGTVGRGIGFGLFGFASASIGKQWKCRRCNSYF